MIELYRKGVLFLTESILFSLLRTAVSTETVDGWNSADLTKDTLTDVYALAKSHDMDHLVGHALSHIGWSQDGEFSQTLHKRTMQAVFRCARQQDEFERMSRQLEDARIPYVPLKGMVIRDWYPEPWMRTSTDIDILVRKEDLAEAIRVLTEKLGCQHHGTAFHDASLFSPSGVHIELHYELADATAPENLRKTLLDVWDHVSPKAGSAYCYSMDADWFYLYHIFHMTKHLYTGGCGIKPFLDLWIMNRGNGYCAKCCQGILDNCGLLTVALAAEKLAEIWFGDGQMDALSRRLADFVLDGGVHGTVDGNVAVAQARRGGMFRSLWQKVFLPYDVIKELYPVLCTHKWLLPICQVLRWFKLLFGGGFGRTASLLRKNIAVSDADRAATGELLRDLGLL